MPAQQSLSAFFPAHVKRAEQLEVAAAAEPPEPDEATVPELARISGTHGEDRSAAGATGGAAEAGGGADGAGQAPGAAARVISLLNGGAAQRAEAHAELASLKADDPSAAAVACACVVPLVDAVLCADAARVGSAEAQRANLLLCGLLQLSADRTAAHTLACDGHWLKAWNASDTGAQQHFSFPPRSSYRSVALAALAAAMSRPPAELTRDDLMLMACDMLPTAVFWGIGLAATFPPVGIDDGAAFGMYIQNVPHYQPRSPIDEVNHLRWRLALEIAREPEALSELELAGLWQLISQIIAQRPALCATATKDGLFEVAVAALRTHHRPNEWVSWRTAAGLMASAVFNAVSSCVAMAGPTVDMGGFLSSGAAAHIVSALQAYEQRGAAVVAEGNAIGIYTGLFALGSFDMAAPEAEGTVAIMRKASSALQFTLDHSLEIGVGLTTASLCGLMCALVFGKEESGGDFSFSDELIESCLVQAKSQLSGHMVEYYAVLPPHWLRPLSHLCVSDLNKTRLVRSGMLQMLVTLLVEALFLDSEHMRKGAADSMKAPIQADAAECLLQIALLEEGRVVLENDGAAMAALRALASGPSLALTKSAKVSADGGMMAIEGKESEGAAGGADGTKHIMMSYW